MFPCVSRRSLEHEDSGRRDKTEGSVESLTSQQRLIPTTGPCPGHPEPPTRSGVLGGAPTTEVPPTVSVTVLRPKHSFQVLLRTVLFSLSFVTPVELIGPWF